VARDPERPLVIAGGAQAFDVIDLDDVAELRAQAPEVREDVDGHRGILEDEQPALHQIARDGGRADAPQLERPAAALFAAHVGDRLSVADFVLLDIPIAAALDRHVVAAVAGHDDVLDGAGLHVEREAGLRDVVELGVFARRVEDLDRLVEDRHEEPAVAVLPVVAPARDVEPREGFAQRDEPSTPR
jgi:hypothetical protein